MEAEARRRKEKESALAGWAGAMHVTTLAKYNLKLKPATEHSLIHQSSSQTQVELCQTSGFFFSSHQGA